MTDPPVINIFYYQHILLACGKVIFSYVFACQSVSPQGSPCDHYPWCIGPHCTGSPPPPPWTSDLGTLLLVTSGGHNRRPVQICSPEDHPPTQQHLLLPPNEVAGRQCFHRCLSFCSGVGGCPRSLQEWVYQGKVYGGAGTPESAPDWVYQRQQVHQQGVLGYQPPPPRYRNITYSDGHHVRLTSGHLWFVVWYYCAWPGSRVGWPHVAGTGRQKKLQACITQATRSRL